METDGVDTLRPILEVIVGDEDAHCRWFNTLSMMENIGAHKIILSNPVTTSTG